MEHLTIHMTGFRRHWVRSLIQFGLWWLAFFLFLSAWWIRRKFGVPTFNQFLFHIQMGFHDLLTAEYYVIKSFVLSCVLLPALAALAISSGAVAALFKTKIGFAAPIVCLLLAGVFLLDQVSFFAYAESRAGDDYFSAHYRDPRQVAFTGKSPRNLVLIYVESLDADYSNATEFGKDLLHRLDGPAVGGRSFARYDQAPGTEWTMAAIVSTQCGVPLEPVTLYDGNVQGEKLKHFLPSAVCLGDVLNDFGYRNIFMGGASLAFAGKGQFFKDHHYAERYGREEWLAQGDKLQNMNGWGLRDDDLFRHALDKVDALEASRERFNLTLLTLDTHYAGTESLSTYCRERGAQSFEDLVECTADQVSDFVGALRQKGYLENTDVVILGDHLAMNNPVIARLKQSPERHIFNLFVAKDAPQIARGEIVHFDLFPTILDFIGIHVPQDRLALGFSGFPTSHARPDPTRLSDMRRSLMHPSPRYYDLWKNPDDS